MKKKLEHKGELSSPPKDKKGTDSFGQRNWQTGAWHCSGKNRLGPIDKFGRGKESQHGSLQSREKAETRRRAE